MTEVSVEISSVYFLIAGVVCLILSAALVVWKIRNPQAPGQPTADKQSEGASCLQLLSLFQTQARLLDFASEDISGYSDEQVGAAVRSVHKGMKKVLDTHFELSPIRTEDEGDTVTLAAGYDNSANRVVGNVSGQPPFKGTLIHAGWQVKAVTLPEYSQEKDLRILVPAEVEL